MILQPTNVLNLSTKGNPHKLKHILISWLIFSTFYWIAAYHKPFHVDEFYSWVYAERCTFEDIIRLKEFGIGHPPLYHFIQKMIQQTLPSYHYAYVRLANYIFGSIFIIIFVNLFLKYRDIPIFCYGVCSSATLLDTFVFSRMWGLVCLSSLLLLWSGENYLKNRSGANLSIFLTAYFLGFVSDYNFILLLPYVVIVLFLRKSYSTFLIKRFLIFILLVWLLTTSLHAALSEDAAKWFLYDIFHSITKISYEIGTVLFKYWFQEPFLLTLLVLCLSSMIAMRGTLKNIQNDQSNPNSIYLALLVFIGLILVEVFLQNDFIRVRYVAPIVFSLIMLILWKYKMKHIFNVSTVTMRLVTTMAAGVLILLAVSPIFWRDLKDQRFVLIFFPYLLLLAYGNLNKLLLYVISIALTISGVIYISSKGVAECYPPPSVEEISPVVFQDVHAYSSQYLCNIKHRFEKPIIVDQSKFVTSCRICRVNTRNVQLQNYDRIWLVGAYNFDTNDLIPADFILFKKEVNLSWLDRFQFKYFTPIYPLRYAIFEYHRTKSSN
jgi:hypothetical protein